MRGRTSLLSGAAGTLCRLVEPTGSRTRLTAFNGRAQATRGGANATYLRGLGRRSPHPSGPGVKVSG